MTAGVLAASTGMREAGRRRKIGEKVLIKPNGVSAKGEVSMKRGSRNGVAPLCRREQICIIRAHLCDIRVC